MAELYLRQGHVSEALAIYRKLGRERPDDAVVQRRLAEVETLAGEGHRSVGPMNFREMLQQVVDAVPGGVSAMIMGFDGIAIESYDTSAGEVDLPTLLIEYSAATQQLRRASELLPDMGPLEELTITRAANTCLLRPLTDDYFLAVLIGAAGLTGKARYLMRVLAPKLQAELV